MKYTEDQYNWLFENFHPTYYKKEDDSWHFFTIPTQHFDFSGTFTEGLDNILDFLFEGNWQPGESPLSRVFESIDFAEAPDIAWNDDEIKKYIQEVVPQDFRKFIKDKNIIL
jgi:hypothetical protein